MLKTFTVVLFCVALVQAGLAQRAVPALSGRVVDTAHIISSDTERLLTQILADHEDSTSNQIAILTVPDLDGEDIESFSFRVAGAWTLGQKDLDNGILLTIAQEDRKMRIEVGYGLEGALPDALAGQIIRNELAPHFRDGDYEAGILAGTHAIIGAIKGEYTLNDSSSEPDLLFRLMFGGIFGGVASIFAFIGIFSKGSIRWFLYLFLIPFFSVGFGFMTMSFPWTVFLLLVYTALYWGLPHLAWVKEKSEKWDIEWSSSGGGSGGWSSSSSSWSSGGGGFSGGGGSFGGGGASGGW